MISQVIYFLFDYITLSVLIIFTSIFFYYFSTSTYDKWLKLNVPHIRPVPLFGNTLKLSMKLEHQVDTFDRIYKQFSGEKFCGLYQMKTPYLMIRDPELINKILVQDFSYFTDHGFDGVYTDPAINVMANSLVFLRGQKWRTMRQKLKTGFTSSKLMAMHDQINECIEHLIKCIGEKLKHTNQIQVKRVMGNCSTDVIGTCVFGLKLDTIKNDNSEFRIHAKKIFHQTRIKLFLIQILQTISLKLIKSLKLQLFPRDSTTFFYSVFNNIINHRNENNVVREDLTQILVEARKELVFNDDITEESKTSFR